MSLCCELLRGQGISESPEPIPFIESLIWIREVSMVQADLGLNFGSHICPLDSHMTSPYHYIEISSELKYSSPGEAL